jgi:NADH:ubiquinone reductase (H+-translocating)
VALAAPRNGIVEIAGPERAPFNEIIARYLKAVGDPREVVRDPEARYWGGRVEEHRWARRASAASVSTNGSAAHRQEPDAARGFWRRGFAMGKDPHVVIIGGGFGGLNAARGLARTPVRVTLVDKRNYHLFRPLLYQAATGLLSGDQIAAPLRSIFSRQQNIEVVMSEVNHIDAQNRLIELPQYNLHYDFLVLATGITYNYFGHDEWKQIAPGLESLDDADRIRGKILLPFEAAERASAGGTASRQTIQQLLTFVIVGAGTVGVEMAGAMAEMMRMALARDFRHINPASAQLILYEAAMRILPTFPEILSSKAHRHLERRGVSIHTGTRVESVDSEGVVVDGKRVPCQTIIWSAGVVASPAARWLSVEADRFGRVRVNPDLSIPGHPNIFAIGDTALVIAYSRNMLGMRTRTPGPLPGVAQPAIQEGRYVADLIRRRVLGSQPPNPFVYWDRGDLAIVGRSFAVADLKFLRFSGFPAWLVWAAVHIYSLIGFANRLFVMLHWAMSFLTKRRQVRIFPTH